MSTGMRDTRGTGAYETVVGLEVHAELCTESKIFCGCKNAFGAPPNTLCCPVCTGMPGALPVLNRQVVEYAVRLGLALGCSINRVFRLDRKHYFYPDLPKGYQISQCDVPLCGRGVLEVMVDGRVRQVGIERIHIEEDAGKLSHTAAGALADYNRSGVPLVEIVTAPDIHSADEAKAVMEALAQVLLYLGVSRVRMQEGNLRADVNVSVRPVGQAALGARVEMKNVNSYMAVHRAVRWEAARQAALLEAGGTVARETRRWDDDRGEGIPMRAKEAARDYRFLPEPDLPVFEIAAERVQWLRNQLPELPLARALRLGRDYGLAYNDAALLCAVKARADFYEAAVRCNTATQGALARWMLGDVLGLLNDRGAELQATALEPANLAAMVALVENGAISGAAGKQLLPVMLEEATPPGALVARMGLDQISDTAALAPLVNRVLAENPDAAADYRDGKTAALGFLVGQCMKASKGRGDPKALRRLLEKALVS